MTLDHITWPIRGDNLPASRAEVFDEERQTPGPRRVENFAYDSRRSPMSKAVEWRSGAAAKMVLCLLSDCQPASAGTRAPMICILEIA